MLKKIKYNANILIALDGIHTVNREKDFEEEIEASLADSLIEDGRASEAVSKKTTYETKTGQETEEQKAERIAAEKEQAEAKAAKAKEKADAKAAAKAAKAKAKAEAKAAKNKK